MKETMTPRERVLATLEGKIADRVPWVELYVQDGMAEKILKRPVKYPENVRLGLEIHERLAIDNVGYDLRPPIYAEIVNLSGQATVKTPWLKTHDDVKRLREWLPDPTKDEYYENAYELLKNKGEYAATASVRLGIAPVYNSMGYEDFIYNMEDDPDLIHEALDVYCSWSEKIIERLNTMDFDVIIASEDIAFKTNPMVTHDMYMEHIFPRAKQVTDKIKKPFIYHSDGYFKPLIDAILNYKPLALANMEPPEMDMVEIKKEYGDRVALMGNIDLHYTLTRGTVEETKAECKERLLSLKPGGGYIYATANGLVNYCIPENVIAMHDMLMEYGWYE